MRMPAGAFRRWWPSLTTPAVIRIPAKDIKTHRMSTSTLLLPTDWNRGSWVAPRLWSTLHPDCDDYVSINFTFIIYRIGSNYNKYEGHFGLLTTMGLPYDYDSVLQYPFYEFGKDWQLPSLAMKGNYPFKLGSLLNNRQSVGYITQQLPIYTVHYSSTSLCGTLPNNCQFGKYNVLIRLLYRILFTNCVNIVHCTSVYFNCVMASSSLLMWTTI